MAEDQLRKAYALIKQGDRPQAIQLIQGVIKQNRESVPAWWLMANALEDPAKKRKALERVIALNADHERAKQALQNLQSTSLPSLKKSAPIQPTAKMSTRPSDASAGSSVELEFDWGKLEAHDARTDAKSGSEDQAIKTASYIMISFAVVVLLGVVFLFVIPSFQRAQVQSQVEPVMIAFFDEMMAGNFTEAETYVCPRYRRDQGRAYYFALDLTPIYRAFEVDRSDLAYRIINFSANSATLAISGTVTLTTPQEEPREVNITEIIGRNGFNYGVPEFDFIREGEQWYICDEQFANS
ncbi:MAG: tetratricopeptide repeat protein [Anaerolineae bacterium]